MAVFKSRNILMDFQEDVNQDLLLRWHELEAFATVQSKRRV